MNNVYHRMMQGLQCFARSDLSTIEYNTLAFIVQRTVRYPGKDGGIKLEEYIPARHFTEGVYTHDSTIEAYEERGEHADRCIILPVSKNMQRVREAIKKLVKRGFIKVKPSPGGDGKGDSATEYTLLVDNLEEYFSMWRMHTKGSGKLKVGKKHRTNSHNSEADIPESKQKQRILAKQTTDTGGGNRLKSSQKSSKTRICDGGTVASFSALRRGDATVLPEVGETSLKDKVKETPDEPAVPPRRRRRFSDRKESKEEKNLLPIKNKDSAPGKEFNTAENPSYRFSEGSAGREECATLSAGASQGGERVAAKLEAARGKTVAAREAKAKKSKARGVFSVAAVQRAWGESMKKHYPEYPSNVQLSQRSGHALRSGFNANKPACSIEELVDWSIEHWASLRGGRMSWVNNMDTQPSIAVFATLYRHFLGAKADGVVSRRHNDQKWAAVTAPEAPERPVEQDLDPTLGVGTGETIHSLKKRVGGLELKLSHTMRIANDRHEELQRLKQRLKQGGGAGCKAADNKVVDISDIEDWGDPIIKEWQDTDE